MVKRARYLPHEWFGRPLPENVSVGRGSWVYSSYAFMHSRSTRAIAVEIGRHSGVYLGTHFELGPHGRVLIGNYCAVVGAVFATDRWIRVGDYAFISHEVVIADHAFATPFTSAAETGEEESAEGIWIGEDAWIGNRAILLGHARIGEGAIVGAGAVVDFAVEPYSIVAGNPARHVGWARPANRADGRGSGAAGSSH